MRGVELSPKSAPFHPAMSLRSPWRYFGTSKMLGIAKRCGDEGFYTTTSPCAKLRLVAFPTYYLEHGALPPRIDDTLPPLLDDTEDYF